MESLHSLDPTLDEAREDEDLWGETELPLDELDMLELQEMSTNSSQQSHTSANDDDNDEDRRMLAVEGLEQLALSIVLQLEAGLRSIVEKAEMKPKIVVRLANRNKRPNNGVNEPRRVTFPKRGRGTSSRTLAQLLAVVDAMHEALVEDIPVTKRDIFYKDPKLFKTQATVDHLVDDIAATLQVCRADMNVRASGKGLFCGGLVIHLKQGGSVVGNDATGSLIPDSADILRFEAPADLAWVLIVEKEAVFRTLCSIQLLSEKGSLGSGILITGKGYPDVATRQLVKTLCDNLPPSIPVAALVDGDPHGLDILSVYKFGSTSMQHEAESLVANRVLWLGLKLGELKEISVEDSALIPLNNHDQKKARAMLKRPKDMLPDDWRAELESMMHLGFKAEIEAIYDQQTQGEKVAQDRYDTGVAGSASDARAGVHSLADYIERKLRDLQVILTRVKSEPVFP